MSNVTEAVDLYLTRILVPLLPGCVVIKRTTAGEKHAIFYLKVPGKDEMEMGRGFPAAKQSVILYAENLKAQEAYEVEAPESKQ